MNEKQNKETIDILMFIASVVLFLAAMYYGWTNSFDHATYLLVLSGFAYPKSK